MKSATLFLLVASALLSGTLRAQPSSNNQTKAVRIIAHRADSTVSLRWAPSSPELFALGKLNGYKLERAEIHGSQAGPFAPMLGADTIRYWPMGLWGWFVSRMASQDSDHYKYLYVAYSMLFSDSANNAMSWSAEERAAALRSQYSYALFAADRDSMAAVGLGLRFEDWFITPGVKYLYRITLLGDIPPGVVASDTVSVGGEPEHSPALGTLRADEQEGMITLNWKLVSKYTAHGVERSDDNRASFHSLNDAPIMTLITGDSLRGDGEHYTDTALTNYKKYHYRVYGYTSFGNKELIGEIEAMPRDRTPPAMPTDVHADNIAVNKVKITWKMQEPITPDLLGFHVGKDTVDEGGPTDFPHITKSLLPTTAREFVDESGNFADKNYYVVEAYDTAMNVVRSFSAYCVMIDSTPPAVPTITSGTIDTNGVVTLNFIPPTDRDYMGYRLLRANDSTHEYSVIQERLSTDSLNVSKEATLTDTVDVHTLTRFVYYKMYSLDFHYNQSQPSKALQVSRPDLIPPVAPVITGYLVSDSEVTIEVVPSSSEDVGYNRLMRRLDSANTWDSIATLVPGATVIKDRSGAVNGHYVYAMQAIDLAGLRSDMSNMISADRYDNGVRPTVRNLRVAFDSTKRAVTLTWEYNDLSEPYSYVIYRTQNSALVSYAFVKDQSQRTYTDTRLPKPGALDYAVKVVTESGAESKLSAPLTVQIK